MVRGDSITSYDRLVMSLSHAYATEALWRGESAHTTFDLAVWLMVQWSTVV